GRLRLRIIPRSIGVLGAVHDHRQITGGALPGTHACGVALLEILPVEGLRREVDISLDRLVAVRFGEHFAVPDCPCHGCRSLLASSTGFAGYPCPTIRRRTAWCKTLPGSASASRTLK